MGLVQAENIQVIGEAYDVALDISFPKGKLWQFNLCFYRSGSFVLFAYPKYPKLSRCADSKAVI